METSASEFVPFGSVWLLIDDLVPVSAAQDSVSSIDSQQRGDPSLRLDAASEEAQVVFQGTVLLGVPASSGSHLANLCTLQSQGLVALEAKWPTGEHSRDRILVEVALAPAALRPQDPSGGCGGSRSPSRRRSRVRAHALVDATARVAGLLLQEDRTRCCLEGGSGGSGAPKQQQQLLVRRDPPLCVRCTEGLLDEDQRQEPFYKDLRDAVFAAAAPLEWQEQAEAPALLCELNDYQKRALSWALWREGAGKAGGTEGPAEAAATHPLWLPVMLTRTGSEAAGSSSSGGGGASETRLYYSPALGQFSREPPPRNERQLSGGILADEMGLGKTVEVIALLSANPPPRIDKGQSSGAAEGSQEDTLEGHQPIPPAASSMRRDSAAGTLIVTPQALMKQWKEELHRHAPRLKVIEYHGLAHIGNMLKRTVPKDGKAKRKRKPHQGAESVGKELGLDCCEEETEAATRDDFLKLSKLMAQRMRAADVVLTTFSVLKDEVHYVSDGDTDRSLRREKRFQVPDSPVLLVDWWRTVMDEAQMAGSGVSAVARMASRLESTHRWAVSGTPIGPRAEVDLVDMLSMLQQDPVVWSGVMRPYLRGLPLGWALMRSALSEVMWRNSKALVANELQLPPRTLHTVHLTLSPVERTFYDKVLENTRKAAKKLKTNDELKLKPKTKGRSQAPAPAPAPAPVHLGKRKWGETAPGHSPQAPKPTTKKARDLEASAWNEIKQLRLACIHPEITSYWKEIGPKINLGASGAVSLEQIQGRMIQQVQVELQAREREMCAVLNKLAEELLSEARDQSSGGSGSRPPKPHTKKKRKKPASEQPGGQETANGPAEEAQARGGVSLLPEGGEGGPEDLKRQAIKALEMSYRIGENGISAAHNDADVTERIEESIETDAAALKAWRQIEVHTARLLAELYCPESQADQKALMERELKKKKNDLMETDAKAVELTEAKVKSLKSEVEKSEAALLELSQKALEAGALRFCMGCERTEEEWLAAVGRAVTAAKKAEEERRLLPETQGLLGAAVIDATKPFEQDLMEPGRNLSTVLAERHLRGRGAQVHAAVAALRESGRGPTDEGPVSVLSGRQQAHPPHELMLWAALESNGRSNGTVQHLAALLRAAANEPHLHQAITTMTTVARSLEREHRKLSEKMLIMDEDSRNALSGMSSETCEKAQDALACKLKLLRLHRDLHKAETELEVVKHNLEKTLYEAETAATGAASLPPQARDRSAKQLNELLFGSGGGAGGGGGSSQRRTTMLQMAQELFTRKKFLQNQLEDARESTAVVPDKTIVPEKEADTAPEEAPAAAAAAAPGNLPLLLGQSRPGNWFEGSAAPAGLTTALGALPRPPDSAAGTSEAARGPVNEEPGGPSEPSNPAQQPREAVEEPLEPSEPSKAPQQHRAAMEEEGAAAGGAAAGGAREEKEGQGPSEPFIPAQQPREAVGEPLEPSEPSAAPQQPRVAVEEEAEGAAAGGAGTGEEERQDGGGIGSSSSSSSGLCPTCFEPLAGKHAHFFPCGHRYCGTCHAKHLAAFGVTAKSGGHKRVPCFYCRRMTPVSEVTRVAIATTEASASTSNPQDNDEFAAVAVQGSWLTKLDAILRRLLHLQSTAPNEKSLVFSAFPEALNLLGKALGKNKIGFVKLETGQKGKHTRALEQFSTDPQCRVFLLSLSAGGAGLTLVSANHVFLLEPALSPGIAQQAVARVHRIGQHRPVHITRFVVRDTVEGEVQRIQESQQALLLSEDNQGLSQVVRNEAHDPAVMRDLLRTVCTE